MKQLNREHNSPEILFEASEGLLHITVWLDRENGVYGVSFVGHQDDPGWADESDSMRPFRETLEFLRVLNPKQLVWDCSRLRSLESLGLTLLRACHAELTRRGYSSVMVASGRLQPMTVWLHITFLFDGAATVDEAIERLVDHVSL